jgi:hypothetical protein
LIAYLTAKLAITIAITIGHSGDILVGLERFISTMENNQDHFFKIATVVLCFLVMLEFFVDNEKM